MGMNTGIKRGLKIPNLLLRFGLIAAITALCLLPNCSGGFGVSCEEARELGPGIFGPDSVRQ